MSISSAQTFASPQRPLPGHYQQTPVATRTGAPFNPAVGAPFGNSQSVFAPAQASAPEARGQTGNQQPAGEVVPSANSGPAELSPVERGAKTINETLVKEAQYPELDNYVGHGISSAYDPVESNHSAWAPFQRHSTHQIPNQIFDQFNKAHMSTLMGIFAEINHAWVVIDNSVYMWDYTQRNPELLGFEDQQAQVTAVQLVTPRKGVFVDTIKRLLVIATLNEIVLIGIAIDEKDGVKQLSLFSTKMSISVKGLAVQIIEGSADGRIFFGGNGDNDVYELTYQQEERWFFSRCARINHVSGRIAQYTPNFRFSSFTEPVEHIKQMVVDDSRSLLYTLSSKSNIRVFHIQPNNKLALAVTKTMSETLGDIGHSMSQTPLIGPNSTLVSISAISAEEASTFHLVAVTEQGLRLFMSASSANGWVSSPSRAPHSVQVRHIKFPPKAGIEQQRAATANATAYPALAGATAAEQINTTSSALRGVTKAIRFAPGYFFCFYPRPDGTHDLFVSAPDTGRIAKGLEPQSHSKFTELSIYFRLEAAVEGAGRSGPLAAATKTPIGYGNELAVQYDQPPSEVAVLTNEGITVYRRQRLVDIFFTAAKTSEGSEGRIGAAKSFVRLYGRSETAATALAVACGEGAAPTTQASRLQFGDADVQNFAQHIFVEHGGKPVLNENTIGDHNVAPIDSVKPSPRHDGIALYISRLVRSFWKSTIMTEELTPTGGLAVRSTVKLDKLRDSQQRLIKLKEFLTKNSTFIDGLNGPDAARNAATRQDEINHKAEHRALIALQTLTTNAIEAISFVLTLFKERPEEVIVLLDNENRQLVRQLTFEQLFSTSRGQVAAKELVKTIVNRNIANGANVDTVADALRRQCGQFCSADDVVIFKAQEQIRRAGEQGINSDMGRNFLNESLRLYKQVKGSLNLEQLHWAVSKFVDAQFYGGALALSLDVAQETDRTNRALSWIQDGRPQEDPRAAIFASRKKCYELIHSVLDAADAALSATSVDSIEFGALTRRRQEAYEVIDDSQDETFQTDLYDWYFSKGQADSLLSIQSPFILTYLNRRSGDDIAIADLLWRYQLQHHKPHLAAETQLALAESEFRIGLSKRIEYLSRAKANTQGYAPGATRQQKQRLLHRVSELLEMASIQDDLLQRLLGDDRIPDDRKHVLQEELGYKILELQVLFNTYADSAGYYDLCLLMYQAADHRAPTDIRQYWRSLIEQTHVQALERGEANPYELVANEVRTLGRRMNLSEVTFPIADLIPTLKRYAFEQQRDRGSPQWVVDVFIDLGVPPESIFSVLEGMLFNEEPPFAGTNKKFVADDMYYVARRWFEDTSRGPGTVLGTESTASSVVDSLGQALVSMSANVREPARLLMASIQRLV